MEALARKAEMITIGSEEVHQDKTLNPIQPLVDNMKLVWNKRTHRGFFLRAEDFFGYVKRLRTITQEMADDLRRVEEKYQGRSDYAKPWLPAPPLHLSMLSTHAMAVILISIHMGRAF